MAVESGIAQQQFHQFLFRPEPADHPQSPSRTRLCAKPAQVACRAIHTGSRTEVNCPQGAGPGASPALEAAFPEEDKFGRGLLRCGIVAEHASQGAALEKDNGPDARTIVETAALHIHDEGAARLYRLSA